MKITLTDEQREQVAAGLAKDEPIQIEIKPEQGIIELPIGNYVVYGDGTIGNSPSANYAKRGRTRETRNLAELLRDRSREADRIEAYVHMHEPHWRANWFGKQTNYYLAYYLGKGWGALNARACRVPGVPYMTRWCADKLLDDLKTGRFDVLSF